MDKYYNGYKIYMCNGYEEIYLPNHHKAKKNGGVSVHIMVAEEMLGRPLNNEEEVHHIDGNRENNNPDNLMVFASKSDHITYHKVINNNNSDYVLYRLNGVYHCVRNLNILDNREVIIYSDGKIAKKKLCPECGNVISYESKVCNKCNSLHNRLVERPLREELKEEIRTTSFLQLGKKYGVSDNAIRKWCDGYGLPRKTSEIKKYSDKEWKLI